MFDSPTLAEPTIIGSGDVRAVSYGNDRGLFVEFHTEDVFQEFESEEKGHPIFQQVAFISVYIPGDKTKKVTRPVRKTWFGDTPPDTERFPAQWAAFTAGAKEMAKGLPLSEWPGMTTSQVKELNGLNIYTVEALAEVSDGNLAGLGLGARSLRDKASAYLARMATGVTVQQAEDRNNDLQRQLDELRASMQAPDAPRRGRPPKVEGNPEDAA